MYGREDGMQTKAPWLPRRRRSETSPQVEEEVANVAVISPWAPQGIALFWNLPSVPVPLISEPCPPISPRLLFPNRCEGLRVKPPTGAHEKRLPKTKGCFTPEPR